MEYHPESEASQLMPIILMNELRLTAFALSIFVTTTMGSESQPAQNKDKPVTDQQRIVGEWMVVQTDHGGRRAVVEDGTGAAHLWSITPGKIHIRYGDGTKKDLFIRLDPDAKPKAIDVTESGETYLGVYALDGESLEIHYSRSGDKVRQRPKALTDTSSLEDRTRRYFRLVRAKAGL
jgi:uncharacterized protein (TIGR03067 family)